ncbi:MAG: SDR family oxidoreductase [Pikeienuella sp.]
MADQQVLFCAGYSYSAAALAPHLLTRGWRVIGTARGPEKMAKMQAEGVAPVQWSDTDAMATALSEATHLLISAAPDQDGDQTLRALGPFLPDATLKWAGYLSTTGVYGDHQGGWVTEETPLTPATKRGQMRVKAEAEWRATNVPLHIFRLAGIYGPGRGPFSKVRNGTARRIIKAGQLFSRIHRDDIAAALLASIDKPRPGAAYNLCDNEAAPPQDVISFAAELLGVAPPPETPIEQAEMSPMAASFYSESKRVSNKLMREELGVDPKYPTYREGLRALLAEEQK